MYLLFRNIVELTTASVTVAAVRIGEKFNIIISPPPKNARTLELNLGLREGFQAGGNDFPQGLFLTLDGDRSHGRGLSLAGDRERQRRLSLTDVGELISLGICNFGKPKEPSARRRPRHSLCTFSFFLFEARGQWRNRPLRLLRWPRSLHNQRSTGRERESFTDSWHGRRPICSLRSSFSGVSCRTSGSCGAGSPGIQIGTSDCLIFPNSHLRSGHREWALLLPAWSVVLVLLTYFTYFSLALFATPAFSDISTITGKFNSPVLSISPPPFNRPAQIQRVASSIQPYLILQTRARLPRCMTYQSHSSIVPCTIELEEDKKAICIYVWVLAGVHDAMQQDTEGRKMHEPKQGTPDR